MTITFRTLQPKRVTNPPPFKDNPERLGRFQPKLEIERPKSLDEDGQPLVIQPPTEDPAEIARQTFERQQQQFQYQYSLNRWLGDVADQLNTMPPFSTFSWSNPNSNQSAIPGTIGFNLNSANTAKLWVKEIGSGNTGWASLTTNLNANSWLTVNAGTYVPTLTNVANVSASSAYNSQWNRVGASVNVSGSVDVDPTLTVTSTQLGISLPVASAFTLIQNCAGTAAAPGIAGQSAAILGDAANDRAQMQWIAGDVTNQTMYYVFSYIVV